MQWWNDLVWIRSQFSVDDDRVSFLVSSIGGPHVLALALFRCENSIRLFTFRHFRWKCYKWNHKNLTSECLYKERPEKVRGSEAEPIDDRYRNEISTFGGYGLRTTDYSVLQFHSPQITQNNQPEYWKQLSRSIVQVEVWDDANTFGSLPSFDSKTSTTSKNGPQAVTCHNCKAQNSLWSKLSRCYTLSVDSRFIEASKTSQSPLLMIERGMIN